MTEWVSGIKRKKRYFEFSEKFQHKIPPRVTITTIVGHFFMDKMTANTRFSLFLHKKKMTLWRVYFRRTLSRSSEISFCIFSVVKFIILLKCLYFVVWQRQICIKFMSTSDKNSTWFFFLLIPSHISNINAWKKFNKFFIWLFMHLSDQF